MNDPRRNLVQIIFTGAILWALTQEVLLLFFADKLDTVISVGAWNIDLTDTFIAANLLATTSFLFLMYWEHKK